MTSKRNILLTGATGLIGGEVVSILGELGHRIWALVRANNETDAINRIAARFARSGRNIPYTIIPVCGDITQKNLGIRDRRILDSIRKNCQAIVHLAGATSFRDNRSCHATNVKGALEIIQESKAWIKDVKLFFLSTSFVCCSPRHCEITEDMPCVGYANGYIESKRIAEREFSNSHLDTVILRPSIVVSRGINDRQFARSILWFIPIVAKLGMIPGNKDSQIDIVGVDYVTDCVIKLFELNIGSGIYNISAGIPHSVKLGEIADIVYRKTGTQIKFVAQRVWSDMKRKTIRSHLRLMRAVEYYSPFIEMSVVYSTKKIRTVLGNETPKCTPFTEYCEVLLDLISPNEAVLESDNP
jgi:nucleoside-diphosphate-sugar epimerase